MTGIYLLLGSNLGHKQQSLIQARNLLEQVVGPVIVPSSFYVTEAWGMENTPAFLNQVVMVDSFLKPLKILEEILKIETSLGRKRTTGYQNRTIDIDILYYHDQVLEHSDLTIPHPRIPDRRFVLEPLAEIAPDFLHPSLGKTNLQLLTQCKDPLSVKKVVSSEF